jgi:hypothetical protein
LELLAGLAQLVLGALLPALSAGADGGGIQARGGQQAKLAAGSQQVICGVPQGGPRRTQIDQARLARQAGINPADQVAGR